MEMYAVWEHAGEMAGDADRFIGIYPDYVSARNVELTLKVSNREDFYITKIKTGKAYIFKFPEYPDYVGEKV